MSTLASAIAALHAATSSAAGGQVTFTRGTTSANVLATYGRSRLEQDDTAGGRIEVESHDFLVLAADLIAMFGAGFTPQEGDRVSRTMAGVTQQFELMTPPYSPSDSTGTRWRLHTKQIG